MVYIQLSMVVTTIDEFRGSPGAIGRKLWGESGGRKLELTYNTEAIIAGGQYNTTYTDETLAKQELDAYLATVMKLLVPGTVRV